MSLSQFDFVITYHPCNLQGKPDAHLHRSYLAPKQRDLILDQQKFIVLRPSNFQLKNLTMSSYETISYFTEVQEALKNDPFVEQIRKRLRTLVEKHVKSNDQKLLLHVKSSTLRQKIGMVPGTLV